MKNFVIVAKGIAALLCLLLVIAVISAMIIGGTWRRNGVILLFLSNFVNLFRIVMRHL